MKIQAKPEQQFRFCFFIRFVTISNYTTQLVIINHLFVE